MFRVGYVGSSTGTLGRDQEYYIRYNVITNVITLIIVLITFVIISNDI